MKQKIIKSLINSSQRNTHKKLSHTYGLISIFKQCNKSGLIESDRTRDYPADGMDIPGACLYFSIFLLSVSLSDLIVHLTALYQTRTFWHS